MKNKSLYFPVLMTLSIIMLTGCLGSGSGSVVPPVLTPVVPPDSDSLAEQAITENLGIQTGGVLAAFAYNIDPNVNLTIGGSGSIYDKAVLDSNPGLDQGTIDYIKTAYGHELSDLGATAAWEAGWTGQGVKVAILDTGVDAFHDDLSNQIDDVWCGFVCSHLSELPMSDLNGHGTHVAGIVAAELNSVGTTGVAPHAQLLIGKIGDQAGTVYLSDMGAATAWAVDNGASVINLSANFNVSEEYKDGLIEVEPGLFHLNDPVMIANGWDTNGYSNFLSGSIHGSYVTAIGDSETILVASAGNQGYGFSTFPAQWAAVENNDGTHLLGGKMLVVGAYDMLTNQIASFSNKAGTTCYKFTESGDCDQTFRVKDYYILAPGMHMASTKANDDSDSVTTMSGTSMAAPVVSGAVALMKQRWPHMSGDNTVKLLLNTADKTIPNYDENIHGQGLLDIASAVTYQGDAALPSNVGVSPIVGGGSSVSGLTVPLADSGTLSLGGMNVSALSKVMIVDDYERDFYVDLNVSMGTLYAGGETERSSEGLAGMNLFSGYNNGVNVTFLKDVDFKIGHGESSVEVSKEMNKNIKIGLFVESDTFLGNTADNHLMDINGSQTAYVEYVKESELNKDVTIFYSAALGATDLNVDSSSQMKKATMLISNAAKVGSNIKLSKNSEFGVVLAAPLAITSGQGTYLIPDSVNNDGTINYADIESSLIQGNREYSLGVYYNVNDSVAEGSNMDVAVYVEKRFNASHGQDDKGQAGISVKYKF